MSNQPFHNHENIKTFDSQKSLFEQEFELEICSSDIFVPFPCIKIDMMDQLHSLFQKVFELEKSGYSFLYRGQANSDWFLDSTLERVLRKQNVSVEYMERKLFPVFKKQLRGKLAEQSLLNTSYHIENDREIWAIGRHYDLKTPLIDWTLSIYIALFMAYSEPRFDNQIEYSALFIVDRYFFDIGEMYVNPYFFTTKMDFYGRVTAKKGFFSTYEIRKHISDKLRNGNIAFKIYVKGDLRKEILAYLKHIGIEYATMYPDLLGVIKSANNYLEEHLIEIEKEQAVNNP